MRFSGQISPFLPPTAPLALRLPQAVYDDDVVGVTSTGPGLTVGERVVRPLNSMRSPVAYVLSPPAIPSWAETSAALGGCACPTGEFFDSGTRNLLLYGAVALGGIVLFSMLIKKR